MRYFSWIMACGAVLAAVGALQAAPADYLISEAAAQRCGLTRAWATQAQVDSGRDRLQSIVLYDDMIFAQSSRSTLEAIDAEGGQKRWTKMVGQPDYVSLSPGVCGDLLGAINGSRLYILNRYTGDILFDVSLEAVPGGAPALSKKRAYVPTASGRIYSYRLDPISDPAKELGKINPNWGNMTEEEKKDAAKKAEEERRENIRLHQEYAPPISVVSSGRALVPPVITTQTREEEFVAWTTDKGYLHLGRVDLRSADSLLIKFRLAAKGSFDNPPAYMPPNAKITGDAGMIFAGSSDGEVYALSEHDGEILWKFIAGDAVIDSPVLIKDRLYVTTELGGLSALTAKTGKQIWWAPEILHFVAAGRQRVYVADKLGRLRILDARTGTMLDILPTGNMPIKLCNNQTDRIYLGTVTGLVQCLHEVDQPKPIVYVEANKPQAEEEPPPAKLVGKPQLKSGEGGAAKPATKPTSKPPAKKPAVKKDDSGFGDDPFPAADADKPAPDKPAKPARGAAARRAQGKANAAADNAPPGN